MGGASDIRAGRAYVEAYLDKRRLIRDLNTVGADLKRFGAFVSSMGRKMMLAGASITGPFLLAARTFAKMGDSLLEMSQRTGVSTEALSELGSGQTLEIVELSIRKMQRTIGSGDDIFKKLGISLSELRAMSPEKQFERIMDALGDIADPTMRAAAAMKVFGKNGTALLPMIGNIKSLREEARRLGLSISKEDAKAADEFADALDKLRQVGKMAFFYIGAAIAKAGFVDRIREYVLAVQQWLKQNGVLVVQVFQLGVALTVTGAAMFALGKIINTVGVAMTMAAGSGRLFGTVMTFLKAAGMLALNPYVLLGAAVLAVAGYFLYTSGAAGRAGEYITSVLGTIVSDVRDAFAVIAEAMATGDFATAAKVGWAFIRLEWARGVNFCEGLWEEFLNFWDEASIGLALQFYNAVASIKTAWAELIGWMQEKWAEFTVSGITETLANLLAPIMAKIEGVSVADARKSLSEDMERGRKSLPNQQGEIDAETQRKKKEIEDERRAREGALVDDLNARKKKRGGREKAAADALAAAEAEWRGALDSARGKADEWRRKKGEDAGAGMPGLDLEGMEDARAAPSRGTFSAREAMGMGVGGGGPLSRIAAATRDSAAHEAAMVKIADKQLTELRRFGMEMQP
jgi:hypothetical protein